MPFRRGVNIKPVHSKVRDPSSFEPTQIESSPKSTLNILETDFTSQEGLQLTRVTRYPKVRNEVGG